MLVGKGITFDTGGISIKPNAGMREMKTDMAGGAAVLAAVDAAARLRLPVAVTAVVPAAENAVSGSSYRPADVVRHVGGRTTEVLNTDAEGRMVLADGLAYARLALGATVLVDVATLTGAMKVALGTRTGGLYATDRRTGRRAAHGRRARRRGAVADAAGRGVPRRCCDSDVADANNAPGQPGRRRRPRCSCGPSPATSRGRTWTSPGPARAASDDGEWSRAAPASARARCCAGWRRARRSRVRRPFSTESGHPALRGQLAGAVAGVDGCARFEQQHLRTVG